MKHYQVMTSEDLEELVELIEGHLDSGWHLQGGVSTTYIPEKKALLYSQAVVRGEF